MCAPFLNLLAKRLTQSGYKKLLVVVGFLMSIIPTLFMLDPFHAAGSGYSAGWLMYMYLLGGYYKLYGFGSLFTKKKSVVLLAISISIMVISQYGLTFLRNVLHPVLGVGPLINVSILYSPYNSPLVLLNSVLIFYLCVSKSKIKYNISGKLIKWLSSVSLGVYIIHAQPFILDHVLTAENMPWVIHSNPILTFLIILGLSFAIILVSGLLEQMRVWLFRLCRIDRLIGKTGSWIDSKLKIIAA